MAAKTPKWSVEVKRITKNNYRTMFVVGVQSFTLAHVEDDAEAKEHCEFIRDMFVKAMGRLGLTPKKKPSKPARATSR